jgi:hypothetical protein
MPMLQDYWGVLCSRTTQGHSTTTSGSNSSNYTPLQQQFVQEGEQRRSQQLKQLIYRDLLI